MLPDLPQYGDSGDDWREPLQGSIPRSGLQTMLLAMSRMVLRVSAFAAIIGVATFLTGLSIFEGTGRPKWIVIGGALCIAPAAAAALAAWRVRRAAAYAPRLGAEVRTFIDRRSPASEVLIDIDSGRTIAAPAMGSLRAELDDRRREFPALSVGVRALMTVPKLTILATVGILAVGGLGTVLFIGAVID